MSAVAAQSELRCARRMVVAFWVFTVLYVLLSAALLVTRVCLG